METREAVVGLSFLLCFLFPAFIMHAWGVFAHSWIRVEDDPCLAIGLLSRYNCCLSIREYKCVPFGSGKYLTLFLAFELSVLRFRGIRVELIS